MFSKKILTNEIFFCSNGGMAVMGGGGRRTAVPEAATGTGRKRRENAGEFFNLSFSEKKCFRKKF